ncbi:AbrB family transcriptional regulator [Mycobacterium sp. MYCO198283]|uniref:AbrB family transcriptional regulator n=1 Tax=Mycobacterium sp. MYCO198283 TaxID=2883505 RepID=UPI001E34F606|nr:AbrB family transcriptional regulator [Mycobacterium sp. MYCO198283]MCG5431697.1 AbrB family transcriptional regulator [Mycobacterium sp. MYCO198283]
MARTTTHRAHLRNWLLLLAATVAATVPLALIGVPSAPLFAALVVGIGFALSPLAPGRVPRRLGVAAQGVLGVYIGTMVQRDALGALGSDWPVVLAVAVGTLAVSVAGGALLGLHREVTPLTGALSLVAGGASGLVAIARELGGDDRIVAVVQYLRVALITASMPIVVTVIYHADKSHSAMAADGGGGAAPLYLALPLLVAIVVVGAYAGRRIHLPGAGLLGPMAITIALQLTGASFGLNVPIALVAAGYVLIGWQAGLAFTREALRTVERILPAAFALIVALNVAAAGLGLLLSQITGMSLLDGYLATSPGGIYAVLATAVETGANVTFVIAAQVIRVLLMLFTAPLLAHVVLRLGGRGAQSRAQTSASRAPIRVAD